MEYGMLMDHLESLEESRYEVIFEVKMLNFFLSSPFLHNAPLDDVRNGVALKNLKIRLNELFGDRYDCENAKIFYHDPEKDSKQQYKYLTLYNDKDLVNVLKTQRYRMVRDSKAYIFIYVRLPTRKKEKTSPCNWWMDIVNWLFKKDIEETGENGHVTGTAPEEQSKTTEKKTENVITVKSNEHIKNAGKTERNDEQDAQLECSDHREGAEAISLKSEDTEELGIKQQYNDDNISEAMKQLIDMGYTNEGGWLSRLVESKRGDVNEILKVLNADYSFPVEDESL